MKNKILIFIVLFSSFSIKSQERNNSLFFINSHLVNSMRDSGYFCSYFNKHKIDIDFQDDNGDTLLIHACRNGYEQIVKFLVEKKAKLNTKNNDGRTALITAAKHNHFCIVKYLIQCPGIDLRVKDKDDLDALGYSYKRKIESPRADFNDENIKQILEKKLNSKNCCVIL